MFEYYRKIDSLHQVNRLLLACCSAFFILCLWLGYALLQAPSKVHLWLTPAMSANGGIIKADEVPNEYVHGFVTTLIPNIHSWSESGDAQLRRSIQMYQHYFTPRFRDVLASNHHAMQKAGLFSRTQTASLYRFMESQDVTKIGSGLWDVQLVLRLTQKLNEHSAMIIADKVVEYHYRVVKVNVSRTQNPFGLAIDGYSQSERLVKDLLSKEEQEGVVS